MKFSIRLLLANAVLAGCVFATVSYIDRTKRADKTFRQMELQVERKRTTAEMMAEMMAEPYSPADDEAERMLAEMMESQSGATDTIGESIPLR